MQGLGAFRPQAITWANVDSGRYRHMASLGHSKFNSSHRCEMCQASMSQFVRYGPTFSIQVCTRYFVKECGGCRYDNRILFHTQLCCVLNIWGIMSVSYAAFHFVIRQSKLDWFLKSGCGGVQLTITLYSTPRMFITSIYTSMSKDVRHATS